MRWWHVRIGRSWVVGAQDGGRSERPSERIVTGRSGDRQCKILTGVEYSVAVEKRLRWPCGKGANETSSDNGSDKVPGPVEMGVGVLKLLSVRAQAILVSFAAEISLFSALS